MFVFKSLRLKLKMQDPKNAIELRRRAAAIMSTGGDLFDFDTAQSLFEECNLKPLFDLIFDFLHKKVRFGK